MVVKIDLDAEMIEQISVEQIKSAKLFFEYENDLELGAKLITLISTDTNSFLFESSDTFATLIIDPSASKLDSILLNEASFELLDRNGNYLKVMLELIGLKDGPSRFLSTDTLNYSIYMSAETIVDPN